MSTSLLIVSISAGLLVLFFVLFQIEGQRQRRLILATTRGRLDIWLIRSEFYTKRLSTHLGSGTLRIALHFVLHNTLGAVLYMIKWSEARLHRLRQSNKNIAKAVTEARTQTHLSQIAEHKETVALSESEKEERRNRSLHEY